MVPIGFVSDHVEVVWDLDNEAAETAAEARPVLRPGAAPRASTRGSSPTWPTWSRSGSAPGLARPGPIGCCPARSARPDFCADRLLRELPGHPADHRRGRFRRRLERSWTSTRRGWSAPASAGRRSDEPVTDRVLRVGTRGSALALAQSGAVADRDRRERRLRSELVRIKTEGDVNTGPLAAIGGTGIFVTAVRAALADGRVDVIVHSFKDLPTAPAAGPDAGRGARAGEPVRRAVRPGRADPGQPAARRPGRHRVAAAGRPTAAPPPGPAGGADPRQRRHPAAAGHRRRSGRRGAGRRRADPAGPDRRDHRDASAPT